MAVTSEQIKKEKKNELLHIKFSTWSELLRKWPRSLTHYLRNTVERDDSVRWEKVALVTDFSSEEWFGGLRADQIVPGTYWINQSIQVEGFVGFCKVFDDAVWLSQDSVVELLEYNPQVFNSRQVQSLRLKKNLPLSHLPVYVESITKQKPVIYVFCVLTGPFVSSMVAKKGDKSTVFFTVSRKDIDYCLCKRPETPFVDVVIPDEVKRSWMRVALTGVSHDFLSLSMYQREGVGYSVWSFDKHTRQIQWMKKDMPPGVIVAPGDGFGLCRRTFGDRVIAGDLASPGEGVELESFQDTMRRGLASKDKTPTLVLSYVMSLMTESDMYMVENWPGAIYIIDTKMYPIHGLKEVCPGVYLRDTAVTHVEQVVEGYKSVLPLFTENLLNIERIFEPFVTAASKYWRMMKPYAPCDLTLISKDVPIVVHTLSEYVIASRRYSNPVWLSLIGGIVKEVVPVTLSVSGQLSVRRVYRIPRRSSYEEVLKASIPYFCGDDFFYFCSTYETTVRIHIRNQVNLSVQFVNCIKNKMKTSGLFRVTPRTIEWYYEGSTVAWLRGRRQSWAFCEYMDVYGSIGWKQTYLPLIQAARNAHNWTLKEKYDDMRRRGLLKIRPDLTPYEWASIPWSFSDSKWTVLTDDNPIDRPRMTSFRPASRDQDPMKALTLDGTDTYSSVDGDYLPEYVTDDEFGFDSGDEV